MTGDPARRDRASGLGWLNVLAVMAAVVLALAIFEYLWWTEFSPSFVRAGFGKATIHFGGELVHTIVFSLAVLGPLYLIIRRNSAVTWRKLGLAPTVPWALSAGFVIGLAAYTIDGLIDSAWSQFLGRSLEYRASSYVAGLKSNWITFATSLPASVVVTPFLNELLFRGVILGWLADRLPAKSALVISALVYSTFYLSLDFFPSVFVLGLIYGWIYQRARSVWPCVVAHGAYNLASDLFWLF